MSSSSDSYDSGTLPSPYRRDQATSNEQWMFGGAFAGLLLVGFAFGVWAGAPPAKPKATETAEAKKDKEPEKPKPTPVTPPVVKKDDPKPEPEPEPKPEPKKVEPEPKKTEPEPKKPDPPAKKVEPEPKKPDRVVLFKEVQPILRAYCNDCHGASTGKPKGGVDTTTLAKMLASKGPPLVPGKPNDSTVYTSVKSGEMPPDGKKGPDAKELQLLHDWIAGGAKERRRTVKRRKWN